MKKKIKYMIIGIVLLGILSFVISCFMTFQIRDIKLELREFYNQEEFEEFREIYSDESSIESGNQWIRSKNTYPSDDYQDYCEFVIRANVANGSFFDVKQVEVFIEGESEDSIIIIKFTNILPGFSEIDSFDFNKEAIAMSIYVYRNGMSDEELQKYLADVELTIYYETIFSTQNTKTIKIGDYLED